MASLSDLTPGTWNVDPTHSGVSFSVRHLMISKVRGRFNDFSGTATIAADPLQSSLEAVVQMASISTGDDNRDGHLKTGDFFDVEQFPTMTFRSTGLRKSGGDYEMSGDLTLHGVTNPVTFEVEFDGTGTDPWGNTKAGFTAKTEINRKDWGLEYNAVLETGGVMIGENVKIELDVQLVKAA